MVCPESETKTPDPISEALGRAVVTDAHEAEPVRINRAISESRKSFMLVLRSTAGELYERAERSRHKSGIMRHRALAHRAVIEEKTRRNHLRIGRVASRPPTPDRKCYHARYDMTFWPDRRLRIRMLQPNAMR